MTLDSGSGAGYPPVETTVMNPRPPALVDNSTGHQAFLLLIGEVVGVFILSWLAGLDDRLATIIVAFMLVLWLLWIMNSTDVISRWGAKVGL